MKEISDFVKKKNIPKDETVYIGGDLNVNKGTPEFKDMLKNLNVNDVLYAGHNSTWDPQSNSIAKYNYPNGKPEHLDYIFTDKDHKQPKQLVNEVVTEKPKPWMSMPSLTTMYTMISQIIIQSKPIVNSTQLTNNSLRSKRSKRVFVEI